MRENYWDRAGMTRMHLVAESCQSREQRAESREEYGAMSCRGHALARLNRDGRVQAVSVQAVSVQVVSVQSVRWLCGLTLARRDSTFSRASSSVR